MNQEHLHDFGEDDYWKELKVKHQKSLEESLELLDKEVAFQKMTLDISKEKTTHEKTLNFGNREVFKEMIRKETAKEIFKEIGEKALGSTNDEWSFFDEVEYKKLKAKYT